MKAIIEVNALQTRFNGQWVHHGLDFSVLPGEIVALIGGSGCGKTSLLRSILMLQRPLSGEIKVFDIDTQQCSEKQAKWLRRHWGVMFQHTALFSSLTVLENLMFPLRELTNLSVDLQEELAMLKISLVGLSAKVAHQYPAQLSGGMQKRVAMARALVLEPPLLFLDEPSAGLDPKSADSLEELILQLHDALALTVVIISHDLNLLRRVAKQVAFLGEGKVLAKQPLAQLLKYNHPLIQHYFAHTAFE